MKTTSLTKRFYLCLPLLGGLFLAALPSAAYSQSASHKIHTPQASQGLNPIGSFCYLLKETTLDHCDLNGDGHIQWKELRNVPSEVAWECLEMLASYEQICGTVDPFWDNPPQTP